MKSFRNILAATFLAAPLLAFAAEPAAPPATGHAMEMGKDADHAMGKMMMGGMGHEEGHQGKRCMDKEKGGCCKGMMGKGMHSPGGMIMIPQLPAGNEKQQLLMQSEIQQKVGEIVGKYAGQLK